MEAQGIETLLSGPDREWFRQPGAAKEQIARLVSASPWPVPKELLELLAFSNGGEGDIPLLPACFVLDCVDDIVASFSDPLALEEFPGLMFIGGNGGGERIALDCRGGEPFPVMAVDPIAGLSSLQRLAGSMAEFVLVLGVAGEDDGFGERQRASGLRKAATPTIADLPHPRGNHEARRVRGDPERGVFGGG